MSELKDFYVEQAGYDYERLEHSSEYLSQLTLRGAKEIDDYILGRNYDFSHVQELTGILKKYQLKDSDDVLTMPNFPYLALWRAIRRNSVKSTDYKMSGLALEMRLLGAELKDIPNNPERLEEFRSLLTDFSKEFFDEYTRFNLVA